MSVNIKLTKFNPATTSLTQESRIWRAAGIAQEGTCRQKHGAVLMQGSRVLAVGVNSYRNDPVIMKWQWDPETFEKIPQKPTGISVHAEVQATKTHLEVPNTTLYVVRIGPNGLMNSKPCPECISHLIWNTSVKEVIYS